MTKLNTVHLSYYYREIDKYSRIYKILIAKKIPNSYLYLRVHKERTKAVLTKLLQLKAALKKFNTN